MLPAELLHQPSAWKDRTVLIKIRDSEAGGLYRCVKEESFFHGFIPAIETPLHLKKIGDFLVRQTVKMEARSSDRDQFEVSLRLAESEYVKKEDEDWYKEWHKADRPTPAGDRLINGAVYDTLDDKEKDRYSMVETGIGHYPIKYTRRSRLYYINGYGFKYTSRLVDYHQRLGLSVSAEEPYAILKKSVKKEKWQFNHEQIQKHGNLGHGAFGEVFRGTLRLGLLTTEQCAVKTMTSLVTVEENEKLFAEAKTMQKLKHRNIVRFLGVASNEDPLMIVMELCEGNSVKKAIEKGDVSLSRKIKFVHDAALGLQYIHRNNVVHADLAARNTLIGKGDVAKISDFGLAIIGGSKRFKSNTNKPYRYLSPLSLRLAVYDLTTDMWAFGLYIYEVFNNAPEKLYPSHKNVKEVKNFVIQGKRLGIGENVQYPAFLWELTKRCWTCSSAKRIKIDEQVNIIEAEDYKQNGSKWFRGCRTQWQHVEMARPVEDGWVADDREEEQKEIAEHIAKLKATKEKKKKNSLETKPDDTKIIEK